MSSESETGEEEELFEVEKIVDTKLNGKKRFYLLKWKGYDHTQNTWENADNLNCDELIEEFNKKQQEIEVLSSKPGGGTQIPNNILSDYTKGGEKMYKVEYPNDDSEDLTTKKLSKKNPLLLIDYLQAKYMELLNEK